MTDERAFNLPEIKPETLEALRKLFPNITEAQVQEFITNLAKQMIGKTLPDGSKISADEIFNMSKAEYEKRLSEKKE